MDDIRLVDKSNEIGRCFKHNSGWQSRVQEVFNKLRNKHISTVYMNRFNKLLCTCEGFEFANLWEHLSDKELDDSVKFLDDYVADNTVGELRPMISKLLERLRFDGELFDFGYDGETYATRPRSSATKFCYLLQKVIEKDFAIMEPRKPAGVAQARKKQKEEKSLLIDLDLIGPDFIKHLIGSNGENILKFMKNHRCRVEINVVDGKVRATIKKSIMPDNMKKLEDIGKALVEFTKTTKEIYDLYVPPEDMDTGDGSENDDEQSENKPDSSALKLLASHTTQPVPATAAVGLSSSVNVTCLPAPHLKLEASAAPDQFVSPAPTQPAQAPTQTTSPASTQPASQASVQTAPIQAPTSSAAVQAAASQLAVKIEPSTSATEAGPMAGVVNHTVGAGAEPDPCPTSCLVHDRRWLSTYQYVLTQCYKHIRLSKNHGSRFSRLVCTCREDRPEARMYFLTEDEMQSKFQKCRRSMMTWPQECQLIIKPLVGQLVKYDKSDIWHSLFKFVFYYHAVNAGDTASLEVDYKLPGHNVSFVPRPEKPYLYQVNFTPNGPAPSSAGTSSGSGVNPVPGTSSSSSNSAPGASFGVGSPGTSSGITTGSDFSTSTTSASAGSSGTSNSIIGPSLGFSSLLDTQSTSSTKKSCADSSSEACGSSQEPKEVSTPAAEVKEKAKLKRVHPDEWSDDCYFHGKKKKSAFQCVVNHLHKKGLLPEKLNVSFSMAVCVCNEKVDFKKYYPNTRDLRSDCISMKVKLSMGTGSGKSAVQPFLNTIEDYMNNGNMTDGMLKFVYFYTQVQKKELTYLYEIHELLRNSRNK